MKKNHRSVTRTEDGTVIIIDHAGRQASGRTEEEAEANIPLVGVDFAHAEEITWVVVRPKQFQTKADGDV